MRYFSCCPRCSLQQARPGPTMTARLRGRVGDGEPAVYGSYLSISCGPEGRTFQHWSVIIAALILCAALLSLRAEAQKCSKPLSKDEIINLLNSHVPATRVGDLAQQYGISFALTPETEAQLRKAGATDGLLEALRPQSCAPPPPPPTVAGRLLIKSTPAGAQVFLDGKLEGTTDAEGELELLKLPPGEYQMRIDTCRL